MDMATRSRRIKRRIWKGVAESMPGALRIDKAAHELMNFIPVKEIEKDGYSVFYHEERLYSVRNTRTGTLSLVYAASPHEAVNIVMTETRK